MLKCWERWWQTYLWNNMLCFVLSEWRNGADIILLSADHSVLICLLTHWYTYSAECVCALCYTMGCRRAACCICGAYALPLTVVLDWEAVIWCICVELSTVSKRVCVCRYTLLLLFPCLSLMGRCTQSIWMPIRPCIWCQCVCALKAFVSVLLPFIFLCGWLNTYMPVVWVCVCVRECERVQLCVLSLSLCVCVFLCVGSGSMCVRVRGEVSLGWPWLESWRRAEVKEEICRKDTHHFPHYYFFFFFFYYVSVSHCFFSSHCLFLPPLIPPHFNPLFLSPLLSVSTTSPLHANSDHLFCSYCL